MSWTRNTGWDCCGTESLHWEPQTRGCQGGGNDETTFEKPATAWSPRTLLYVWSKSYRGDMQAFKKANCVSSVFEKLEIALYVFGTFFGNLFSGAGSGGRRKRRGPASISSRWSCRAGAAGWRSRRWCSTPSPGTPTPPPGTAGTPAPHSILYID